MSEEKTIPEKLLCNPLGRQKDTVKYCHCAMFSGDSYVRPVFAVPGKPDIWEFQIQITIYLINTKYWEMRKTKQSIEIKP